MPFLYFVAILTACCFGFLKGISCYSRRDDNFISNEEKFVWCKQIRNSLFPWPFQNKILWKWQLLNFEIFQSLNFEFLIFNQPNIQWCPWVHITSFLVSPLFWFIGWVVGFPQLIWEYPKNLPPSPSHFWGGWRAGVASDVGGKRLQTFSGIKIWQWFLQPISFTPNSEITPLCDKKNI